MHDAGFDDLQKIIKADMRQLQTVRGIGPKKSKTFYTTIKDKISRARLYRLMLASSCFKKGMGKTYLRMISINVPTFLGETNIKPKLTALRGIGNKRANTFIDGLEKFKVFIQDYPQVEENNKRFYEDLAMKGFNSLIKNKSFVFTDLDDDNLEDYIIDHQGVMSKTVRHDTAAVITGNVLSMTTKRKDAMRLGIRVYTVQEFIKYFNVVK